KFWCTTACETCLIFAHIKPALQAPELLVSVVVSQDLSVRVYFKYAPLVSDDVCIPCEIRDVRVLDNLLDDVERSIEKKAHQQEDKQLSSTGQVRDVKEAVRRPSPSLGGVGPADPCSIML
ncbi:hypothetical protein HPB47_007472, partial [Ixodes persulcatus]